MNTGSVSGQPVQPIGSSRSGSPVQPSGLSHVLAVMGRAIAYLDPARPKRQAIDKALSFLKFIEGTHEDTQAEVKASIRSYLRTADIIELEECIDRRSLIRLVSIQRTVQQFKAKGPYPPVDLRGVDWSECDFSRRGYPKAEYAKHWMVNWLWSTDLTDASLAKADLTEANLTKANLTKADLSGASLTKATLTGATLTGASLNDADLSDVIWGDTSIGTLMAVMTMSSNSDQRINWARACLEACSAIELDDQNQLTDESKESIKQALDEMNQTPEIDKQATLINFYNRLIEIKNQPPTDDLTTKATKAARFMLEVFVTDHPILSNLLLATGSASNEHTSKLIQNGYLLPHAPQSISNPD